jgi:hypothetical protein
MELAGIKLGSSGQEVMKRYGKGLYVKDEGHTGGVYYVTPDRSFTLHLEFGVDYSIDSISISKGIDLPKGYDEVKHPLKSLETVNLKKSALVSWGKTPEDIIKQFGKPNEDKASGSRRTLKFKYDYQDEGGTTLPCQLNYEGRFEFEKSGITKIAIYCGE